MKTTRPYLKFLLLSAGLVLGACGSTSSLGGTHPGADAGQGADAGGTQDAGAGDAGVGTVLFHGSVQDACGPADGPALRMVLWPATPGDDCAGAPSEYFQTYWWMGAMPTAGADVNSPDNGSIDRCDAKGCLPWEGSMHFDSLEAGVGASGSLDFWVCDVGDCGALRGSFSLCYPLVDPGPLCG